MSGNFEVKDTCRDRGVCVEAKQGVVLACPSDGEDFKVPYLPSKRYLSSRGSLVICPPPWTPYKYAVGGRLEPSLGLLVFVFHFSLLFSLG